MRTFVTGITKIDVLAQISREALELDWLVLSRALRDRKAILWPLLSLTCGPFWVFHILNLWVEYLPNCN
jgi:hypothetical protein